MKRLSLVGALLGLLVSTSHATDTPDYWNCTNRIGGSWTWGTVPSACDVDPFGDPDYVRQTFGPLLFQDSQLASSERPRYVREAYATLKDGARWYLLQRKPAASGAEQAGWTRAVLAVAAQETWWTHYRTASDGRTKMVRGDSGHGHGMMQIDDRWHFAEIQAGKGWQLGQNLAYALELYFAGWERAASASCVGGAEDWRNRARSAYSQYNGGASKLCRFANPNDTWARNDIGYADKYDQQAWLAYVSDPNAASKVNISCLMADNEACPPTDWTPADWGNRLLQLETGEVCVFQANALTCVTALRDSACLSALTGVLPSQPELLAIHNQAGYPVTTVDRHSCPAKISGLRPVASALYLKKSINLRSTPGGALLGTVPLASTVQVLDWETRTPGSYDRYYQVRYQGQDGWLYAGSSSDQLSWADLGSYPSLASKFIVQTGYKGKVTMSGGINLRSVPATGTVLTAVPTGALITVSAVKVLGDSNAIYYQASYNGQTGWLYGGQVLPTSTLTSWVVPY